MEMIIGIIKMMTLNNANVCILIIGYWFYGAINRVLITLADEEAEL